MGILADILNQLRGKEGQPEHKVGSQAPLSSPNASQVAIKAQEVASLIHPLEGHELDDQQLACIAQHAHNHLVLAGAGTGKTTTIVGLAKYLLKTEKYAASEILALSFTHASASELASRIRKETGQPLEGMTFHKLGMDIIAKAEGKKPLVSDVPVTTSVRNDLKQRMMDPRFARRLAVYLYNRKNSDRYSQFDATSQEEYDQRLRENPPTTMNGERVKSFGEVTIANFLLCNGIAYEYERPYECDTATQEHAQYCPDFYLPDYRVYIEFFAVDKTGNVPAYFTGRDGKSGKQTYLEGIAWKRGLHKSNGTDCIELFAYQEFDDTLQDELRSQLVERGIPLVPIEPASLWEKLGESRDEALDAVAQLFATVISLLKSSERTPQQMREMCRDRRSAFLFTLVEPVYNAYQSELARNRQIDFDDMIIKARKYVEDGSYRHGYRLVIIDEYQDISASRQSLVRAMRQQSDFDLFCVGDDWQSIYRFSGSDIGYILDFDHHWGGSVVSRIETTRRFPQSLIDVSSSFVMANPRQTEKHLRSSVTPLGFGVEEISAYSQRWAFAFAVERMRELPLGSSVLLLGRYRFDVRTVSENGQCCMRWDAKRNAQVVGIAKRPDLDVVFRTIHQAKGLEADYVFILNNRSDALGFPSQIEDDPAINLLLSSIEDYPQAEERRLFYVALTRARKKVFLLTEEGHESSFVLELRRGWEKQMKNARYECPLCGGKLSKREGPYSVFLGCDNYFKTGCKFKRQIRSKEE